MKIHKDLFGTNGDDKIHVDEIAIAKDLLLGQGVIVESGSNENGYYIKLGNGVLIYFNRAKTTSTTSTSLAYYWNISSEFINPDDILVFCDGNTSDRENTSVRFNEFYFQVNALNPLTVRAVILPGVNKSWESDAYIYINMLAIGKWK